MQRISVKPGDLLVAFIDRNDPETDVEVALRDEAAQIMADNAGYLTGTVHNDAFEGMCPDEASRQLGPERGVDVLVTTFTVKYEEDDEGSGVNNGVRGMWTLVAVDEETSEVLDTYVYHEQIDAYINAIRLLYKGQERLAELMRERGVAFEVQPEWRARQVSDCLVRTLVERAEDPFGLLERELINPDGWYISET